MVKMLQLSSVCFLCVFCAHCMAQPSASDGCRGLPGSSFAELASGVVPPLLSSTRADLQNVSAALLPEDPFVHSYRKLLLALKNNLEVFAAAYPQVPPKDPLKTLENFADDGYEKSELRPCLPQH